MPVFAIAIALAFYANQGITPRPSAQGPCQTAYDPATCTALGHAYEEGIGYKRPHDLLKAAQSYTQACNGGDIDGCLLLGAMASPRPGGEDRPDNPLGPMRALFKSACDNGHIGFCDALAAALGPPDEVNALRLEIALELQSRACAGGLLQACRRLAQRFATGLGTPKNLGHAAALSAHSCGHGAPMGCMDLAQHYEHGAGVPKDLDRARAYRRAACALSTWGAYTPQTGLEVRDKACTRLPYDVAAVPASWIR